MNRTQLKVSGLVNGLSLLEAEFVNHRYERHFHDELVFGITESGTARINCWGGWFTAGPGDIFVSRQRVLQITQITVGTNSRSSGLDTTAVRIHNGRAGARPYRISNLRIFKLVYRWLRSPFLPLAGRWDFFRGRAVLARWINVGTIV